MTTDAPAPLALRLWGARGSVPAPGPDTLRHGGNTSCVEVTASGRRLVLASTRAALPYTRLEFRPDDILLFGRESAGVPDHVHETADARILIPMMAGQRSVNVAMSAAMIAGEALRQVRWN